MESVIQPPSASVLDINFFRSVMLCSNCHRDKGRDKSLLLTGSLAAFKEQAGLFVYSGTWCHGPIWINTQELASITFYSSQYSLPFSDKHPAWHLECSISGRDKAAEVSDYVINITATSALKDGTLQTELAVYGEGGKGWQIE
ncbi:hypothetical protein DPV78_001770 [Talaromyces pinophilus]|nr:hypothetical protein DPV78_001770 [Talaromyces pinophilus]